MSIVQGAQSKAAVTAGIAEAGSGTLAGEAQHSQPPELVATVLQLLPDQLSLSAAQAFQADVAPRLGEWVTPLQPLLRLLCHLLTSGRLLVGGEAPESEASEEALVKALAEEVPLSFDILSLASRTMLLALRMAPAAVRSFWEQLPRRRDRDLVEKLVARSFSPTIVQAEAAAATAQLEAQQDRLPDIEASVSRRPKQLVLNLSREDLRAELCVQLPAAFPLRLAMAEPPEKMPGIPKPRIRNWMLQARQVLAGQRPLVVGRVMLMWARSFALFFEGVEDCPICYNVVHLTTQTIPRKACPTCKHKFHNECLYHWFKTSSKTTCPLCNQPF